MGKLGHAKQASFAFWLQEARHATLAKHGLAHAKLLSELTIACRNGGLRGEPGVYQIGFLREQEASMKECIRHVSTKDISALAHKLPAPSISPMGGLLDHEGTDIWNFAKLKDQFVDGSLVLIETEEADGYSTLVSHACAIHLSTFKTCNSIKGALLQLVKDALPAPHHGGKRPYIDLEPDEEATESPEASPDRAAKRPRLDSAPAPAEDHPEEEEEVLMQSDAMDLDAAAQAAVGYPASAPAVEFAEKFGKILNLEITDQIASTQFSVDAAWAHDIDGILFENQQMIVTMTTALLLQRQLDDMVESAAQTAKRMKDKADDDYKAAVKRVVHVADVDAHFHFNARLIDAHRSIRADIDKLKRLAQDYQSARPLVAGCVSIFFERATPASQQEQNKLLAAAYLLVRNKRQLPALLSGSLPRCSEPGCANLVHPHFGEPCCKHICLSHRAPEHVGHVSHHGATREAAAPVPEATMHEISPSDAAAAQHGLFGPLPEFDAAAIALADSFLDFGALYH